MSKQSEYKVELRETLLDYRYRTVEFKCKQKNFDNVLELVREGYIQSYIKSRYPDFELIDDNDWDTQDTELHDIGWEILNEIELEDKIKKRNHLPSWY